MPGLPNSKDHQELSLPMDSNAPGDQVQQPRQPQNLQGLLRFAMEASASTAAPSPPTRPQPQPTAPALDDERRHFLQEALQSMTVDVIAIMQANINKLTEVGNISEDKLPEKVEAFETILDYVDNVDIANDFHKINGFRIFEPCLGCQHAAIRSHVCDLIAELAQNNPYIQTVLCECTSVMARLLRMLKVDESVEVRVKALRAISAMTRESDVGYATFKQHKGLDAMLGALQHEDERLQTKAAFLLSSLHLLDKDILNDLISLDCLAMIVKALNSEHKTSHEHLLRLLLLLVENSTRGLQEFRSNGANVAILSAKLQFVTGKDEYKEEQDYCTKLLKYLK